MITLLTCSLLVLLPNRDLKRKRRRSEVQGTTTEQVPAQRCTCNTSNSACNNQSKHACSTRASVILASPLPRFPGLTTLRKQKSRECLQENEVAQSEREWGRNGRKGSTLRLPCNNKRRNTVRKTRESYDTYLEYHAAQLCSEQQLLPLRDQGIDHEVLLHICKERHVSTILV
jgi:hypothetical protein